VIVEELGAVKVAVAPLLQVDLLTLLCYCIIHLFLKRNIRVFELQHFYFFPQIFRLLVFRKLI